MLRTALIVGLAALSLVACQKRTRAPGDPLVCFHVVQHKDGTLKYNKLPSTQPTTPPVPAPPTAACWKYQGEWRRLPGEQTLSACVQTLFAGRCEKAGSASYGRWGQQTLRLVPGRVEVSTDDRSFRSLAEQASNCVVPPLS